MIEAERRIREALEKAPTHGEWVAYRTGGRPEVSHAIPPFIAACNPTNIAALLADRDEREARLTRERDEARAERDALAKDAERYRFIREDGHYLPKSGEWLPWVRGGSLDTLVDAALAQIERERSEQKEGA